MLSPIPALTRNNDRNGGRRRLFCPENGRRITVPGARLEPSPGSGALNPMPETHIAQAVQLLAHRRAGQCRQPALPGYRQRRVPALDHRAPFRPAQLPSFRAKNHFRPSTGRSAGTEDRPALIGGSSANPMPSNTLTTPSNSCLVRWPLIAASATFALNAALCFLPYPLHVLLPRYPRFLGSRGRAPP